MPYIEEQDWAEIVEAYKTLKTADILSPAHGAAIKTMGEKMLMLNIGGKPDYLTISGDASFARAQPDYFDKPKITVKVEMDAYEFQDVFGSYLSGPWRVEIGPIPSVRDLGR